MPTNRQTAKIKCPHCGWIRTMTIQVEDNQVDVYAGFSVMLRSVNKELQEAARKLRDMLADKALNEANAWLPMPPCPNPEPACGKTYEYNIYSG